MQGDGLLSVARYISRHTRSVITQKYFATNYADLRGSIGNRMQPAQGKRRLSARLASLMLPKWWNVASAETLKEAKISHK